MTEINAYFIARRKVLTVWRLDRMLFYFSWLYNFINNKSLQKGKTNSYFANMTSNARRITWTKSSLNNKLLICKIRIPDWQVFFLLNIRVSKLPTNFSLPSRKESLRFRVKVCKGKGKIRDEGSYANFTIEPRPSSRGLPYANRSEVTGIRSTIPINLKHYSRHRQWHYNYRYSRATCHAHYITIDSLHHVRPRMRSLSLTS